MAKKALQIFLAGKHTSSAGQEIDFSDSIVSETASVYDPKLHEAPIVVGHPKDNAPAYGWIKGLEFQEGALEAEPHQVDAEFEEMVNDGHFKKISASFYSPDSPQNPVPGSYYLRHVGFLGAQAPAVKGMRTPEFNEQEEGVIEFSEAWSKQSIAGIFQRLRDFLIEKFDKDTADEVIPSYALDDIKDDAREALKTSDYHEQNPSEDDEMKKVEELQAQLDAANAKNTTLEAENTTLKTENTNFKEREATIIAQEKAADKAAIEAKVDALIKDGKVLPKERESTVAYAQSLDNSVEIEFGEGDDKKKVGQRDQFLNLLGERSKQVDFKEYNEDEVKEFGSPQEMAQAALDYQQAEAEKGHVVDIAQAVKHVQQQQ